MHKNDLHLKGGAMPAGVSVHLVRALPNQTRIPMSK